MFACSVGFRLQIQKALLFIKKCGPGELGVVSHPLDQSLFVVILLTFPGFLCSSQSQHWPLCIALFVCLSTAAGFPGGSQLHTLPVQYAWVLCMFLQPTLPHRNTVGCPCCVFLNSGQWFAN